MKIAWDETVCPSPPPPSSRFLPLSKTNFLSPFLLTQNYKNPSSTPIHLILSSPPLSLQFNSLSQRLIRLEINSNPTEWIKYRGKSLDARGGSGEGDGEEIISVIRRVMGPTYSSSKNFSGSGSDRKEGGKTEEEEEEILSYPGVVFGIQKLNSS